MRVTSKIYVYKDIEFTSLKALAQYTGVHEKTITARLRKGMSVDDACKNVDLRCSYMEDNNVEKSISQICREQSKNSELVRNRLARGYTLNDALNKPKKIARQGKPIIVNGVLYNSISEAIKKLKLSHKESTIRSRLKLGKKPDDAFNFD